MKRRFFLFALLVFFGCSDQAKITKLSESSLTPDFFNDKLKTGLDKDSLVFYALQLDAINKVNIPDSLQQEFLYTQFRYLFRLDEMDSAISILQQVIGLSEPEILSAREAKYYRALMNSYSRNNDFLNCLGTSEKMFSLLAADDFYNKARVYYYRNRVFISMGNYDQALETNAKAIELFELTQDTFNIVINQIDRASIYFDQNNLDEALNTLENISTPIDKMPPHINYQFYGNLGSILFEKEYYNQALIAFQKASQHIERITAVIKRQALINNYVNLSNTFLELGQLETSSVYLDSVFILGLDNVEYSNQKEALKTRLKIEIKKQGDLKQLVSELDSIFKYQEAHYETRVNTELAELEKSFAKEEELKSTNRTIELQNLSFQRNQYLLLALLLTAILTATLILFYNRQRKFKMEKQNFLLQQRLLRSQMNPHFTFNSLNLIKNEIKKDAEKSSKYIVKFSRMLRTLYENSTKDYVPVTDEMELLADYLDMQQFRFSDRFAYEINNEIPEESEIAIPPMLLQPFVENAITHGFEGIDRLGHILINISSEEKFVSCTIEDNGIGFDTSALRPESSVQLIDLFLKKMTGQGITVSNKKDTNPNQQGAIIKLNIPFKIAFE